MADILILCGIQKFDLGLHFILTEGTISWILSVYVN